jgi:aspartate/tyrosine/aromatic aminotransferase
LSTTFKPGENLVSYLSAKESIITDYSSLQSHVSFSSAVFKTNTGIVPAYRDENGKPWVLPFVLDVENRLLKSYTYNHEYVVFWGLEVFNELVPHLILGENSPALNSGRVSVTQ